MTNWNCFDRTTSLVRLHAAFLVAGAIVACPADAAPAAPPNHAAFGSFASTEPEPWFGEVRDLMDRVWIVVRCSGESDPDRCIEDQMLDMVKCITAGVVPSDLSPQDQERLDRDITDLRRLLVTVPESVSRVIALQLDDALERLQKVLERGRMRPQPTDSQTCRPDGSGPNPGSRPIHLADDTSKHLSASAAGLHTDARRTAATRRSSPTTASPGRSDTQRCSPSAAEATLNASVAIRAPESP